MTRFIRPNRSDDAEHEYDKKTCGIGVSPFQPGKTKYLTRHNVDACLPLQNKDVAKQCNNYNLHLQADGKQ